MGIDRHGPCGLAFGPLGRGSRATRRLDTLLEEMKAEMPAKTPAFNPDGKTGRKNLKTTKELAEKERRLFESRL